MSGNRFEVYEDANRKFRWRLFSANGQVVATGRAYATRRGAHDAVQSVRRAAAVLRIEDLT